MKRRRHSPRRALFNNESAVVPHSRASQLHTSALACQAARLQMSRKSDTITWIINSRAQYRLPESNYGHCRETHSVLRRRCSNARFVVVSSQCCNSTASHNTLARESIKKRICLAAREKCCLDRSSAANSHVAWWFVDATTSATNRQSNHHQHWSPAPSWSRKPSHRPVVSRTNCVA
jgi:hypothetical protein